MRAIVIHEFGPPDMLKLETVPDPVPRRGEVRVKVHAATVNRVLDVALRAGSQRHRNITLPLIPGVDCAGIVDAVGPGVTRFKLGDRVAGAGIMPLDAAEEDIATYTGPTGFMGIKRPGGFAEMAVIHSSAVTRLPEKVGFHEAAVAQRHCPVAWNLLFNLAKLNAGERVLVMGAAGNLGSVGIQIAKNLIGAHVIAAAGADERIDMAMSLGADHGINYNKKNLRDEVLKITNGKGVDVVYDNIANPKTLPEAFRALGDRGRLVTAGSLGGPSAMVDFYHLTHHDIKIRGSVSHRREDIAKCFAAVADKKIALQIARVMPLAKAAEAHRIIEADPGFGKIVLDPTLDNETGFSA